MENYSGLAENYLSEVLSIDPSIYTAEAGKTTCIFDPENWSYIVAIADELETTKSSIINSLVSYARQEMARKNMGYIETSEGYYRLPKDVIAGLRDGKLDPLDYMPDAEYISKEQVEEG